MSESSQAQRAESAAPRRNALPMTDGTSCWATLATHDPSCLTESAMLAKGGRDADPSKRRQPRLSVSALLCRYSLLAGHADRDTFALRLLTRCAFGSLESFRDFRGGLFAGRALQKPNVFLRPRSPCRSLLRSRRRLRHVWFSLVDPTYLPRFARFASSAAVSEPDHTSTLEDHQSDQVSQSDAPR